MLQRCLHGINNMAKDHTISYQREKTKRSIAIKDRLSSAGVNIYFCFICHVLEQ